MVFLLSCRFMLVFIHHILDGAMSFASSLLLRKLLQRGTMHACMLLCVLYYHLLPWHMPEVFSLEANYIGIYFPVLQSHPC